MSKLALNIEDAVLRLKEPFRITGHEINEVDVIVVSLSRGAFTGRGEASGVYYFDETTEIMRAAITAMRFPDDLDRAMLRRLMLPGGARNAIDCALWDLEAQERDVPVWTLAGLSQPKPLVTTMTIGAEPPDVMAFRAHRYQNAKALKLKLTGDPELDAARVRAVKAVRPDVWLGVDANQGYVPDSLKQLMPVLVECQVALLEQPFARGGESAMDGLDMPIPFAADESCQDLAELETMPGRFDVVNIKLDKCGGLTEGLMMARRATELGLGVMVGNMVCSSLGIAPGYILGQLCSVVDLDGPLFLTEDQPTPVVYADGMVSAPAALWGGAP
jgi:L-Ala-D/L-Glu epimerase